MLLDFSVLFSPFSFSLWKPPGVATTAKREGEVGLCGPQAPTSLPHIQYTDPIGSRIQQKDGREKPWCNSQPLQAPQCSAAMVQDASASLCVRLLDKQTPLGTSKEALGTLRNVLMKVTAAWSIANPRQESTCLIRPTPFFSLRFCFPWPQPLHWGTSCSTAEPHTVGTAATGKLSTRIKAQLFTIFLVLLCAEALAQPISPLPPPPPLLLGLGLGREGGCCAFGAGSSSMQQHHWACRAHGSMPGSWDPEHPSLLCPHFSLSHCF